MGKATKELTPCQRYIAMITIVALLVYSIYNTVLVVRAYGDFSENVGELSDLVDNWESTTILDIKMMQNCPTGYSAGLTDRNWPGTNTGCHCGGVSSTMLKKNNITCTPFCSSSCSTKASGLGCKTIAGQNPQALNYWIKKSSTPLQPCLKRSDETFASTATLTTEDGQCPPQYLKCGTTAENVFCTKESQCPISNIQITSVLSATATATCTTSNNCQIISDIDGSGKVKTLTYKRADTYDALPLTEFIINEYGMCDLKDERDVTPGRAQYYLLKNKPSSCAAEGTSRWSTLDSVTEKDLFSLNGNIMGSDLYTYVKTTLAPYTQPSAGLAGYYPTGKDGTNYNWKMFGRDYIPWKISCREKMATFIDKSENVNRLKKAQLALLVIGILSTIIIGVVLFMELQNLRGVDLPCIPGKGEEERKRIKRIKKILTYVSKLSQLPFQIWAISLAATTKGLFDSLVHDGCSSDVYTQVLIATLSAKLKTAYTNNIIAISLLAVSLLIDLVLMLFEKKEEKNLPATKTAIRIDSSNDQASQSAIGLNNSMYNNSFANGLETQQAYPNQAVSTNTGNIVIQLQAQPMPVANTGMNPTSVMQPQMIQAPQMMQGQYPQGQVMQQNMYPQGQVMQQGVYPQPQFAMPQQQGMYPQQQYGAQPQYMPQQGQYPY